MLVFVTCGDVQRIQVMHSIMGCWLFKDMCCSGAWCWWRHKRSRFSHNVGSARIQGGRCQLELTRFNVISTRKMMGLCQCGGGKGRARTVDKTPKGVKKSQSRLSESGHHRRTSYKRGAIEAELTERLAPNNASNDEKTKIRQQNKRARADLMSKFNEEAGCNEGERLEGFPKGVSLLSSPVETDRHIVHTYVGFGLSLQYEKEKTMANWSSKEAQNARQ